MRIRMICSFRILVFAGCFQISRLGDALILCSKAACKRAADMMCVLHVRKLQAFVLEGLLAGITPEVWTVIQKVLPGASCREELGFAIVT